MLERFIHRFNAKFAVKPEQPDSSYRPLDPGLTLAEILCFKHSREVARDNTVKYNWRALQLLPGEGRPSYAGAKVEVLELPDGSLRLQHEGKTIPAKEAPKSPGALRATSGFLAPTPEIGGIVYRLVKNRLTQPQLRKLASMDPIADDGDQSANASPASPEPPKEPVPTPGQLALWKAVHHAMLQGLLINDNWPCRSHGLTQVVTLRKWSPRSKCYRKLGRFFVDVVPAEAVPVGLLPALSSTMAPATLRHTSAAAAPIPSNQTSRLFEVGDDVFREALQGVHDHLAGYG